MQDEHRGGKLLGESFIIQSRETGVNSLLSQYLFYLLIFTR